MEKRRKFPFFPRRKKRKDKRKEEGEREGNARIEKQNWNKEGEEWEEIPAVVVNQSGNESKGRGGGSGRRVVGGAGRGGGEAKTKGRVYRQGEVARNGKRIEQAQKDARRRETDAVNARCPRGAS